LTFVHVRGRLEKKSIHDHRLWHSFVTTQALEKEAMLEMKDQNTAPYLDDPPIPAEALRKHVEQILASPQFDASERNRRFLHYIIEETLAGRADRVKGYGIALAVFDRDESFDPQVDPVVRIEASRLRRSLERYYLTDGRGNRLRISIPKGGYVPHVEIKGADITGDLLSTPVAPEARPSLSVLQLRCFSSDDNPKAFAAELTEEIIAELVSYRWIHVFPSFGSGESPERGVLAPTRRVSPRFVFSGSVRCSDNWVRVIVHLVSGLNNEELWVRAYERDLGKTDRFELQKELAVNIVGGIAAPGGPLARWVQGEKTGDAAELVAAIDPDYLESDLLTPLGSYRPRL
jgi:TolB-like protein